MKSSFQPILVHVSDLNFHLYKVHFWSFLMQIIYFLSNKLLGTSNELTKMPAWHFNIWNGKCVYSGRARQLSACSFSNAVVKFLSVNWYVDFVVLDFCVHQVCNRKLLLGVSLNKHCLILHTLSEFCSSFPLFLMEIELEFLYILNCPFQVNWLLASEQIRPK